MKLTEAKLKQMIKESLSKRQAIAADINTSGLPMGTYSAQHYANDPIADYLERGKVIKKLFHQHADHAFMDTLVTVHYRDLANLPRFKAEVTSRDELSCVAYKSGETFKFGHPLGQAGVGIAVKGRITLLTNNSRMMVSGRGEMYTNQRPERTKSSGANKGVAVVPSIYDIVSANSAYVLDSEDWNPSTSNVRENEALVDNWRIYAYVVESDKAEAYVRNLIRGGLIDDSRVVSSAEFGERIKKFER